MLSSRRPLLPVVLGVLVVVCSSTALRIPSSSSLDKHPPPPNSISNNITGSPPKAAPPPQLTGHLQLNLTYTPWPNLPYTIPIHAGFASPKLTILRASEFLGPRPISMPGLRAFVLEFRDNLERESPVPGYVPRNARQDAVDLQSYTKWTIDMGEGFLGYRMPTEFALVALEEIATQLGRHGPAEVWFTIKEGLKTYSYGYLEIKRLGAVALNRSLGD